MRSDEERLALVSVRRRRRRSSSSSSSSSRTAACVAVLVVLFGTMWASEIGLTFFWAGMDGYSGAQHQSSSSSSGAAPKDVFGAKVASSATASLLRTSSSAAPPPHRDHDDAAATKARNSNKNNNSGLEKSAASSVAATAASHQDLIGSKNGTADRIEERDDRDEAPTTTADDGGGDRGWTLLLNKIPMPRSFFLDEHPRGLRLALVGDSVTRFQSISLMYFLNTGRWFPSHEKPSIVVKDDFTAYAGNSPDAIVDAIWNVYLNHTSHRLGEAAGRHWCDCYRVDLQLETSFENRYFRDTERDNYVYFLTKFGTSPAQGRWLPAKINEWTDPMSFNVTLSEAKWVFQWEDIINHHLALLVPKPTHVVFNEGLWKGLTNDSYKAIKNALAANGMRGIYKTTTKQRRERDPEPTSFDRVGCSLFQPCLDLSWTYALKEKPYYIDNVHFITDVYTLFNQQLLRLLRDLR